MSQNQEHDPGHGGAQVRSEKTDVDPVGILRLGLLLGLITVVTVVAILPFFQWLESRHAANDPASPPIARYEFGREPPAPRLEEIPTEAIAALRARHAASDDYGWVDADAGIARIPISRAINIVLARGLPFRPSSRATDSTDSKEDRP